MRTTRGLVSFLLMAMVIGFCGANALAADTYAYMTIMGGDGMIVGDGYRTTPDVIYVASYGDCLLCL